MKIFNKLIYYWLPLFLWMGLIYFFSSQTRISVTKTFITDFIIFKTLHILEYAMLYFLSFRAIYSLKSLNMSLNKISLIGIFFSIMFAFSDEFHQLYVVTRNGQLRDVFIDTLGISLMFLLIKNNINKIKFFL